MAPGGGGKRKRGDRTFSQDSRDDGQRPSPHRPSDLSLGRQGGQQQAQNQHYQDQRRASNDQFGGGGRRGGRGGRGRGSQRSPINSPNNTHFQPRHPSNSSTSKVPAASSPKSKSEQPTNSSSIEGHMPTEPDPTQVEAEVEPPLSIPYEYEYATDDRIGSWKQSGKQDLVKLGTEAVENEDDMVLGLLFQELVQCGLRGRLSPEDAGSTVRDVLGEDIEEQIKAEKHDNIAAFDAPSVFLDTISILAESSSLSLDLLPLVAATGIPAQKLRHELDSSLLEHLGLVRKNIFVRVGIRQQTNLLYRQSNYNLLREESEGYSKLVTDLFTTSNNELPTNEVVEETFERVKGMIGAFDLDVGRVLDISLDVFGTVLVKHYRFFIKYFRASSWWPHEKGDTITTASSSSSSSLLSKAQLGPLPIWALPASVGRPLNEEEKMKLSQARTERDELFWQRARQIGMQAYFELGGRQANEKDLEAAVTAINAIHHQSPQSEEERRWIEITQTLPPVGSKVAAQILGFKLRFYVSPASDNTSASDALPANIIYLAALLIKIGFVSLQDLYPHLWPDEDGMETLKEEQLKEKMEREAQKRAGGGVPNALASAKPLSDDPDPRIDPRVDPREAARLRDIEAARRSAKKPDALLLQPDRSATPAAEQSGAKGEESSSKKPQEQKVRLLKSLLAIGALPEALYMFGRFPWLVDAFPDMPEYIHRILHHCLSKVYEPLRPLEDETPSPVQDQKHVTGEGAARGLQPIKLWSATTRRRKRWAQLDQDSVGDGDEFVDYRFYWDDWSDIIPVCQNVDDVFTLCSTLLNLSGVRIGQDPGLLLKLARIGVDSLTTDSSSSNMNRWIDLSKRLLVPALSFTNNNPSVVHEVYELIKHFPYPTRYSIYAEWYSGQISRQPEVKLQFDLAKAETKAVLKRISKTNLKPMAAALGKIAYANPGIVFAVAIAQLESYDNIIDVVVECARYFTALAYDVLTWSLMNALGGRGRMRVQADGMLTSRWLAALSLFAGKVFKRYSIMKPTPIVQYVAEQLRKSNPTDLIVLEEMINSMAGIMSNTTFNEAQMLAMGGGDLLQAQTILQLLDKRHESKQTARRLIDSLTESGLAGQLLVLIAQERQTCIFKIEEQDAHPKLLGNLFDQIHRIFTQYYEFLRYSLPNKQFNHYVPSVVQLVSEFGIDVSIAFWICRPSIIAAMADYDAKYGKRHSNARVQTTKDAAPTCATAPAVVTEVEVDKSDEHMTEDKNARESGEKPKDLSTTSNLEAESRGGEEGEEGNDVAMQDSVDDTSNSNQASGTESEVIPSSIEPWHPILKKVMDNLQPALPPDTWKSISPSFFVTFWQCSLHDMFFPVQSYEDEIQRQRRKIPGLKADRSDISVSGTQKKEREIRALEDLSDRLQRESKERFQNYNQVRQRLRKEKEHWFAEFWGKADDLNLALVEKCFFPRLILSPMDAVYTFKMLKYLHSSGAMNFRTVGVYDQLFITQRLISMIFLCSAREAENLGRFLHQLLLDLSAWHKDKAKFEKEAYGIKKDLPGFAKRTTQDKKPITDFYDFEDFRRVLRKWHMNLTNALKTCLTGREYMHVRNAINILNNVYQTFPAITFMGKQIVECVTKLSQNESRGDLKLAAVSLLGNLKRMEKQWVMPQAFNLVESGPIANNSGGGRAGSANPKTPRSENDINKSLNPKAPDFQPGLNNNEKEHSEEATTTVAPFNPEDGEINDTQTINSHTQDSEMRSTESVKESTTASTASQAKARPTSPKISEQQQKAAPPKSKSSALPHSQAELSPSVRDAISTNPSIPPKPEISRNTSVSTRGQQGLPARPEPPQMRMGGDHRIPPRPAERMAQENHNDSRFPEQPPTDRPTREPTRARPERGPPSFQDPDKPDTRSRGDRAQRFSSESGGAPQTRSSLGTQRTSSNNTYNRESRNYHENSSHNATSQAPQNYGQAQNEREVAMPPPRSNIPQNSERAGNINPERAALIHGRQEIDRSHPAHPSSDHRGGGGDGPRRDELSRSGHSSRGASPSRGMDRGSSFDSRRFDRSQDDGGYRAGVDAANQRGRYDDGYAPSGPRMDRQGPPPSSNPSSDRFRESMKSAAPSGGPAAFDPGHGRLNQDSSRAAASSSSLSSRQSESQYGRLNAGSDMPPSGPRMPNGNHSGQARGGRNVSASQQPTSSLHQSPSAPSQSIPGGGGSTAAGQDKHHPTNGSSSSRGTIMDGQAHTNPNSASTLATTSTTTSQGSESASVHPDRLRAIQGNATPASTNVHPDRLPGIEGNNGTQRRSSGPNRGEPNRGPRQPPPLSVPPTQGPSRSTAGSNISSSPVQQSPTNNRGGPPPTGPSFGGDRNRDKRMAGYIQGVLQQTGPTAAFDRSNQGASIRGRGRGMMPSSPPSSGPPHQNFASANESGIGRDDPFAGRSNGSTAPGDGNDDSAYGRGGRRGPHRDTRESERRSGRHRSRSPGKDGGPDASMARMRDDGRPPREDPRDRFRGEMAPPTNIRGSGPGQERDMHGPPPSALPPPMPERELRVSRATRASTREEPIEGRSGRDPGFDGRDGGGGGGSLRKRARGREETTGERNLDVKRPRR